MVWCGVFCLQKLIPQAAEPSSGCNYSTQRFQAQTQLLRWAPLVAHFSKQSVDPLQTHLTDCPAVILVQHMF